MIRLAALPSGYKVAHVVGGGPSAERFDMAQARADDALVIATSAAAYALEGQGLDLVQITADYPFARDRPVARGALGVWVRLGDAPFPAGSAWPCWVPCSTGADHWGLRWGGWGPGPDHEIAGLMVAGGAGAAAWNLADLAVGEWGEVHLWGLGGGGRYEVMRPGLDYAARACLAAWVDHAGRMTR